MIKEKVKKDLKEAIEKSLRTFRKCDFRKLIKEIHLEHPENPEHGDYSSNFALIAVQRPALHNPLDLAKKIVENFPKRDYLEKVEAVKPGFINFYLSKKFLASQLNQIFKEKDRFGAPDLGKGTKVIIEFGQPNTHKLPHVGHLRSYTLGESLARLLEFSGFKVFRANYQGDVGLHVAKCLWAYLKKGMKKSKELKENVRNLQEAYVLGSKMYEGNKETRKEIDELNLKIYQKNKDVTELWKKTRQWSLDYYDLMNKHLGTKYHKQYFESEAGHLGKKIVLENVNKVFKKSKGAIVFPGEEYGLHTRVFITSAGNPAYEAKDLGLIFLKKRDFSYDLSLISTASEQVEYFKVVYKAAEKISPDLAKKFVHIPFGLVSLKGAKLSSRKGNIVSIDELLENVTEALIALMEEKEYLKKQIEKIVEPLTIGACKYSLLKHTPIKNIVFDVKESVALEGNSAPYLQYTNARAQSILRKVEANFQFSPNKFLRNLTGQAIFNFQFRKEELVLLRFLYRFPEIIERAAQSYSPNLICNYLFELAQRFNTFYESLPVLKAKNENLKKARLALVKATSQVLKNGLNLLGISAPEKM